MIKYSLILSVLFLPFSNLHAQKTAKKTLRYADFTATIGSAQGAVAGSYIHNWNIGKKKKWEAGLGLRWTTYFGNNTEFITADAKLARTSTVPFLIFFAGQKEENFDTLTISSPLASSINLSLNLGYAFSSKWNAGFNIDMIGFTFGKKSSAILRSNGMSYIEPSAKPAPFNALLTGDNDRGTLNSEFFVRYKLNSVWSVKAVYQFLFVEYKTTSVKQTAPDGTMVDRFRNKANNFGAGVSYQF